MKRMSIFLLCSAVAVCCINMGTGKYTQSVTGDKVPLFELKEKKDHFIATVVDRKTITKAFSISFFNRHDDNCYKEGEPVGEIYLEAFPVGKSGKTEIRLEDIISLEVIENKETKARLFIDEERENSQRLKVRIVSLNEAGKKTEEYLYVDKEVAIGYKFQRGKKFVKFSASLRRIDKIENIKKLEQSQIPPGLVTVKESDDR